MSNFALIPQGSLIVYDVIVATQQFIDTAPAEWKDQWAYIIDVDADPQVSAGWVYDPGSGSFYPPAPPPPPPSDEPIVSYDQLLVSQGYSPDVTGARTVTSGDPADIDVQWAEDRLFQGTEIQVTGANDDANVDLLVINPIDGSVIGEWGTSVPVPPSGSIKTMLSVAAPIPAGAIVRLKYHGMAGAVVYTLFRTWRKT